MKIALSILIVVAVCVGGWKIWDYWAKVREQENVVQQDEPIELNPTSIPGLPYQLEPKLTEAKQRGAKTLKQFIDAWKNSPEVKDPRLAWIELDYVTMIASSDPIEAKRIFLDVKKRIHTNSVIYPRIRSLSKAYE
jgi:hypothetical protein